MCWKDSQIANSVLAPLILQTVWKLPMDPLRTKLDDNISSWQGQNPTTWASSVPAAFKALSKSLLKSNWNCSLRTLDGFMLDEKFALGFPLTIVKVFLSHDHKFLDKSNLLFGAQVNSNWSPCLSDCPWVLLFSWVQLSLSLFFPDDIN